MFLGREHESILAEIGAFVQYKFSIAYLTLYFKYANLYTDFEPCED